MRIGIIGGSGLYEMMGLERVQEVLPETPFGTPSDPIVLGVLDGVEVCFLPRHGRGHRISPSELPARANIYALKFLGVERIVSVSAVGSLKEEYRPRDIVVPDQLIDRTKGRPSTFFEGGIVAHIAFAEPFCGDTRRALVSACREVGAPVHDGGTYVVIEGPAFSTRAESFLYRSWGADIIGMTALPEAKLAREAEICYATLAFVTDYDCWHPEHDSVTVEMVLENLRRSAETALRVLRTVIPRLAGMPRTCPCPHALQNAIVTARDRIPPEARQRLALLVDRYLGPG